MNALRFHILPVYSEEHPDPQYQIGSLRLLRHQVETLNAFSDPDIDVIFNIAMTGDGKSLAAYLPAFINEKSVIAMYPTNELVRDQYFALPKYEQDMKIRLPDKEIMTGGRITQLMLKQDISIRLEAVRELLEKNPILLTNPDLLHLIMSHQYGWDFLRKELPATLGANFGYFLFDEFHIFGVPQVISVMNILGYLNVNYRHKPEDRKKFIFLSATPIQLMDGLLDRGDMHYRKITGHYRSTEHPGYHCILQPCELELHEISQDISTETWIEAHLEDIHKFFAQNPTSKAAILVYSVATARRLLMRLTEYFKPLGITVGENTGWTNHEEKLDSLNKHILIGTSTVDIGVDFHINYLIFEAFNSGTFLQRFGRLGRHPEFPVYHAYALIPRFVLERLNNRLDRAIEIERETFNVAIREAFPTEQQFVNYTKRWGVVQATQVLIELQGQRKKDANQPFTNALSEQYELFYGSPAVPVMPKAEKKYWRLKNNQMSEVLADLRSFRGQSPFSCGVWDTTDDALKTYELFFLLANTEYEVLTEAEFMREVKRRNLEERDFRNQLVYLKIHKFVPERQQLILGLAQNLGQKLQYLHNILVWDGFFVDQPRHTWLNEVNKKLKKLRLTCILSDKSPWEIRKQFKLGIIFPAYRLEDTTGYLYSVAFGQEALLLDSVLFYCETKGDKAIMA